jgi:ferredoxin--NADP+ reductase
MYYDGYYMLLRILQAVKKDHPEQFRLDYALSREQKNAKGGKMYIQDKVEEYADEVGFNKNH